MNWCSREPAETHELPWRTGPKLRSTTIRADRRSIPGAALGARGEITTSVFAAVVALSDGTDRLTARPGYHAAKPPLHCPGDPAACQCRLLTELQAPALSAP